MPSLSVHDYRFGNLEESPTFGVLVINWSQPSAYMWGEAHCTSVFTCSFQVSIIICTVCGITDMCRMEPGAVMLFL